MPTATASSKLLEPILQLAGHYTSSSEPSTAFGKNRANGQDKSLDNKANLQKDILAVAGLTHTDFSHPDARFPTANFSTVLSQLTRASGNPHICLRLAEATQPRMLGSTGFLISTAETLGQALNVLEDYLSILYEGISFTLERGQETSELVLNTHNEPRNVIEFFIACLINWPRWLTGSQIPVNRVQLAFSEPEHAASYQQLFAAEVFFNADRYSIQLPTIYLDQPCIDANREMHQLHKEFADGVLSKRHQKTALAAQVRSLIRQQLLNQSEAIKREDIAQQLGLSLRTLQRKLGELNTNFQSLYDQSRKALCLQLIDKGALSFGEVAFQLGFSNQSAFQKAFKRWMGMAPSRYREQRHATVSSIEAVSTQPPIIDSPLLETGSSKEQSKESQSKEAQLKDNQSKIELLLEKLDNALPREDQDQRFYLFQLLEKILAQLSLQSDDGESLPNKNNNVLALPKLEYRTQLAVLERISLLAQRDAQPLLSACAISQMTLISLKQDLLSKIKATATPDRHNDRAQYAYIGYAWVANWFFADYALSAIMLDLGLQRNKDLYPADQGQDHAKENENRKDHVKQQLSSHLRHCSQVQHWLEPIAKVIEKLQQTSETFKKKGDTLLNSEQRLLCYQLNTLAGEQSLTDIAQRCEKEYQQISAQYPMQAERLKANGMQLALYLQGKALLPSSCLYQDAWQGAALIRAAFLLNHQVLWPKLLHWQARLESELPGYFIISETLFYIGMMRLILSQQALQNSPRRQRMIEQIEARFALWAQHCPDNFLGQLQLLQAEKSRLGNQQEPQGPSAHDYYEKALKTLNASPFIHHRALAYERYGDYLSQVQQDSLAIFCQQEAKQLYQSWGASAKVAQLEQ